MEFLGRSTDVSEVSEVLETLLNPGLIMLVSFGGSLGVSLEGGEGLDCGPCFEIVAGFDIILGMGIDLLLDLRSVLLLSCSGCDRRIMLR